jgi:hypothetical protein
MRITRSTVIGLALLFTGACAPVVGTARTGRANLPMTVLTMRELGAVTSAANLYEAIESLRPNFIRSRGSLASVALDGSLVGQADLLRFMDARTVQEVRIINASEAFFRFGGRASGPVLLVTTRRG